jgi:hypothetical protein
MLKEELKLSDERPDERSTSTRTAGPAIRLWRRISNNSAVTWPLAYLGALIWLGIALTRRSPLDFAVIGVWCALGTSGLAVSVTRARRLGIERAADTESGADKLDGPRSDLE